ncbi:hypothetical protein M6I34_13835 [Burkholderiaceae bacterium FT117]|uniref:ShlB/FhaC/HecB family hemolysin secretion/activation protein n=1 Tax=Zeimonas sediminis TaxID=2944268 RepID=UPI002342DF7F|nr:ShlB/FhaC/HecB family hemolysin secretion/activation protein [Zeimonas sediminis]MCM5571597.1 hypothetical protein [Zeimonas sediminis]
MKIRHAALAAALSHCLAGAAAAQSFFGTVGVENAVGVERGSTALLDAVDRTTFYFTLDSFGSEDVGPWVSSLSVSRPRLLAPTDQLDATAVIAGPGQDVGAELRAYGLGYRAAPWGGGTTLYLNTSHAEVAADGPDTAFFRIRGERTDLALGLRRQRQASQAVKTTWVAEFRAREARGTALDATVVDESLRALFAGARRDEGAPFGLQTRLAFALSKGLDALGSSPSGSLLGSNPGAETDFFRASFSAEASIPLSGAWLTNLGVVGQFSGDSLPVSQQCGFGTNAYSRGFDQSKILGDECLAARAELASNLSLPRPGAGRAWVQAFGGVDAGRFRMNRNPLLPSSSDGWSSASIGVRALGAHWIGEISATRVLEAPRSASGVDRTRIWLRTALRF